MPRSGSAASQPPVRLNAREAAPAANPPGAINKGFATQTTLWPLCPPWPPWTPCPPYPML